MVRNDQWLPYSSDLAAELKKDELTNRGSFGEALDELVEILKNLEASTPQCSTREHRRRLRHLRHVGKSLSQETI